MTRRGSSLLEALLCCFFIACVVLAAAGLWVGAERARTERLLRSQAAEIADRRLEEARASGFPNLTLGNQSLPAEQAAGVEFQVQRQIAADPGTSSQVLKIIRVQVNWTYQRRAQILQREHWLSAIQN